MRGSLSAKAKEVTHLLKNEKSIPDEMSAKMTDQLIGSTKEMATLVERYPPPPPPPPPMFAVGVLRGASKFF